MFWPRNAGNNELNPFKIDEKVLKWKLKDIIFEK